LLEAQPCGLRFQLEFGDALAQRIEFAFQRGAALVAAAQPVGQVVVLAALGQQLGFARHLGIQRVLKPALRRGIGQPRQLVAGTAFFGGNRRRLGCGNGDGARQFLAPRGQGAQRKPRFLQLALQRALLLARFGPAALGGDHPVFQLGMAFLAVSQLHVEFFKPALGGDLALLQCLKLGLDLGQVGLDLLAAGARLLGQLAQAQHFDLQRMALVLRFARFTASGGQALAGVQIAGFAASQCRPCLLADQHLRTQAFFQVVDLLRAGQQAGLLRIGRIKTHAVRGDGMAAHDVDRLARQQARARGQGIVQHGRSEAAV